MVRKIPAHLDNPIDNALINVVEVLNPVAYACGMTPNMITYLSGIFQLAGVATMYFRNSFWLGGILFFKGYFYDVMDGNFARRYKMTSAYGDKLDHYKDTVVSLALFSGILAHPTLSIIAKCTFFGTAAALTYGNTMYVVCQEKYCSKDHASQTLSFLRNWQVKDVEKTMKWARWFGFGTSNLWVLVFGALVSAKIL